MRVQFDYDINDVVDASGRMLFRSPTGRRRLLAMRTNSAVFIGVFAGAFACAVIPEMPEDKIVFGLILAVAIGTVQWLNYPRAVRRAWQKQYLALLGSEGPFTCEVELRPEGIWARHNHTQTLYEWPGIASIEETDDSVDFRSRFGGYLVVRDRAFWSPEERDKFIATARRYHEMHTEAAEIPPP
jgi:hypothetical protein